MQTQTDKPCFGFASDCHGDFLFAARTGCVLLCATLYRLHATIPFCVVHNNFSAQTFPAKTFRKAYHSEDSWIFIPWNSWRESLKSNLSLAMNTQVKIPAWVNVLSLGILIELSSPSVNLDRLIGYSRFHSSILVIDAIDVHCLMNSDLKISKNLKDQLIQLQNDDRQRDGLEFFMVTNN